MLHAWVVHVTCIHYAWNMHVTCMELVTNHACYMHGYPGIGNYACNMHGHVTCMNYACYMHVKHQENVPFFADSRQVPCMFKEMCMVHACSYPLPGIRQDTSRYIPCMEFHTCNCLLHTGNMHVRGAPF